MIAMRGGDGTTRRGNLTVPPGLVRTPAFEAPRRLRCSVRARGQLDRSRAGQSVALPECSKLPCLDTRE